MMSDQNTQREKRQESPDTITKAKGMLSHRVSQPKNRASTRDPIMRDSARSNATSSVVDKAALFSSIQ